MLFNIVISECSSFQTKKLYLEDFIIFGPQREKTCLRWFANNKGADKPAHPRSLISAFAIPVLESIIYRLASSSIFWLVNTAEQAGLNLTLSETPKTGFLATRLIYLKQCKKNQPFSFNVGSFTYV